MSERALTGIRILDLTVPRLDATFFLLFNGEAVAALRARSVV